jgi:hypothetical protein
LEELELELWEPEVELELKLALAAVDALETLADATPALSELVDDGTLNADIWPAEEVELHDVLDADALLDATGTPR